MRKAGGKVQVGPDGKILKEEMKRLLTNDARAFLRQVIRLSRSKIGSTQLHRLASELYALRVSLRHNGVQAGLDLTEGSVKASVKDKKLAGDAVFLYGLLANETIGDGIDMQDLDLLEKKS